MRLQPDEEAMLDGREGPAVQQAMALLVQYGEALGAERMVDVKNVCGANIFTPAQKQLAGGGDPAALFSQWSLNSDRPLSIPPVRVYSCQLIGPMDREAWAVQGMRTEDAQAILDSEAFSARLGIQLMNTCTPYQVGNVPVKGEHCAWMESSAVVYINSVLGARSNVEGRESAAAAMLTGKVPYWGYHIPENRRATHLVWVDWDVERDGLGTAGVLDRGGARGRGPGDREHPPCSQPGSTQAFRSRRSVLWRNGIPGITAEARTVEEALHGAPPRKVWRYGARERRETWEHLNSTGRDPEVDLVMIGCPHASVEQIWEVCRLLDSRRVHENTELWIFTPRALRQLADRNGYTAILEQAGARLMSDTCPAIGQFLPKGTKVVAMDSAKQAHYLPALMGVQGWFGSVADCVEAAVTGRWQGGLA